jgi:hypothetical protein
MVERMDVDKLLLGHFGISQKPQKLIQGAKERIQQLLDIVDNNIAAGQPENIIPQVYEVKMLEAEKLKQRGQVLYDYLTSELIKSQARIFTEEYLAKYRPDIRR